MDVLGTPADPNEYMHTETHSCKELRLIRIQHHGQLHRRDDGYTGVKPQHCYITCSPWHRPPPSLDCFYSNKNKFVQIEDTKIKTERGC